MAQQLYGVRQPCSDGMQIGATHNGKRMKWYEEQKSIITCGG